VAWWQRGCIAGTAFHFSKNVDRNCLDIINTYFTNLIVDSLLLAMDSLLLAIYINSFYNTYMHIAYSSAYTLGWILNAIFYKKNSNFNF